jgi:hypothetical protein
VAVNNSIKVGPLVFLLYKFVITENNTKRPVFINMSADIFGLLKPQDEGKYAPHKRQ